MLLLTKELLLLVIPLYSLSWRGIPRQLRDEYKPAIVIARYEAISPLGV